MPIQYNSIQILSQIFGEKEGKTGISSEGIEEKLKVRKFCCFFLLTLGAKKLPKNTHTLFKIPFMYDTHSCW